jgi:hypothetical protein
MRGVAALSPQAEPPVSAGAFALAHALIKLVVTFCFCFCFCVKYSTKAKRFNNE